MNVNKPNADVVKPKASEKTPGRYNSLVQFASLAVMTQGVLLLNQIVLLPIQIRIWGTETTAYWISIMAVASITGAADFGLRSAGHADLMRQAHDPKDLESRLEFQRLWAWIRILIFSTTALLITVDFIYYHFYQGQFYPVWRPALVIAIALEITLGVRITYLDSLGLYREAEAGYLVLAAARLILAVAALLLFHAQPVALAWIWFFTGVFAIMRQGRLCGRLKLLLLFEPIPPGLSFKTLAIVRHTMADPCSGWVRISAPVVVLTIISQPIAIVTYVALRAVFGAARTTILQLSRYASVEFLTLRQKGKGQLADVHLTMCVLLSTFFAAGVTAAVIVDNGRLAALMLNKINVTVYREMVITFGLGSAFYCYQLTQAVSRRAGEVDRVAHRQYFYILCAAIFAIIALVTKSTLLWLILMLAADILISLSFLLKTSAGILSETSAGWRGCVAATASSVIIFTMWLVVHFGDFAFLNGKTITDFVWTAVFYLPWILMAAAVDLGLLQGMPVAKTKLIDGGLEWWRNLRATKLQNE